MPPLGVVCVSSHHSMQLLHKMRVSRKRKMVNTGRMPGPMAKRPCRDEILQRIYSFIIRVRRSEWSSTSLRTHCRRRKAMTSEAASVRNLLPAAPMPVISSSSKKRKMANNVQILEPKSKRHYHSQDEFHHHHHQQQDIQCPVLPEDLVFEIMLRLPERSVGRFRCVCKTWLSIAARPSFIKMHIERNRSTLQTVLTAEIGSCPEVPSVEGLYAAVLSSGILLRRLPLPEILNQSTLIASCDGLLLIWCNPMERHCVINPLTGHFYILPPTTFDFHGFLGFYFHQPSSEYRVLASSDFGICYVNVIGKSNWRRINDHRLALLKNFNSVEVGRSLYWLAWKELPEEDDEYPHAFLPSAVMAFDKEAEAYSLLPLPPAEELKDRGGNLMDFNGELGLWLISDDGIIDLWILKEHWIKRCSVFHPDLELFPKDLSYIKSEEWQFGSAVSVNGEKLIIGAFRPLEQQFLVHWNLKDGACLAENFEDYALPDFLLQFPYIESLALSGHSEG